jgi:hypothetical protein
VVIIVGDMNYRIEDLGYNKVLECIYENKINLLLENDQLSKKKKEIFENFEEGEITFLPSYKFDKDTDIYDTSEKRRVPSYCDRVLYQPKNLELINYDCYFDYKTSDHKPVSALFKANLKYSFLNDSFLMYEGTYEMIGDYLKNEIEILRIEYPKKEEECVLFNDDVDEKVVNIENLGWSKVKIILDVDNIENEIIKNYISFEPKYHTLIRNERIKIHIKLNADIETLKQKYGNLDIEEDIKIFGDNYIKLKLFII